LTDNEMCDCICVTCEMCDDIQTMSNIVNSYPLTKLAVGGLQRLYKAAVDWLMYGT